MPDVETLRAAGRANQAQQSPALTESTATDDRPSWWRPLAPNPWPGNPNAYECPWGCNGTGHKPEFSHIQGGACFGCHGVGWILGRGSRPAPVKRSAGRRWRREGGRVVPA